MMVRKFGRLNHGLDQIKSFKHHLIPINLENIDIHSSNSTNPSETSWKISISFPCQKRREREEELSESNERKFRKTFHDSWYNMSI